MKVYYDLVAQFQKLSNYQKADLIDESQAVNLGKLLKKHKISNDEYTSLKTILGRAPSFTELGIFSAMWSEHCSYKSSRIHLRRLPTTGKNVVVGPGENAGVVRLSDKLCVAFKMESHNHPSYIEPYQGAATGVGGILRDVFCMGARPVANLNALRFGSRKHPRTSHLLEYTTKGIGDYGNCVGIPTVAGSVSFDDCYDGNCLVNAMTVGLIHEDRIFKGYASGHGNYLVYVGSATGRDGIHGATMASDSFASQDNSERSTVQVGDPFTEKLLLEATLEAIESKVVIGLQDMGAAGLTSSSFEMADRAGNGLFMNLDLIPTRTEGMSAYELMLSESQERMLMVCEPDRWLDLQKILQKWQLAHAVVGFVTDTGRVQILKDNVLEVDVPVAPLTDQAPKYDRPQQRPLINRNHAADTSEVLAKLQSGGLESTLKLMLAESGSKRPVYRQYDHHIGRKTVLGPEEQGSALLWIRSDWASPQDSFLGLAITTSCDERYCANDPFLGAQYAVLKGARSIAALGAEVLAATDCLNYGNPENPEVMFSFSQGIDGISKACLELGIPVVSGNVSLYNETDGQSIFPTPMIGLVGKHPDVRTAPKAVLSQSGKVYALVDKQLKFSVGGSALTKVMGLKPCVGSLPEINWLFERESRQFIASLCGDGRLSFCRDVGRGGILTTLVKASLIHRLGISVDFKKLNSEMCPDELVAFGDPNGCFLLSFKEQIPADSLAKTLEAYDSLRLVEVCEASHESTYVEFIGRKMACKDLWELFSRSLL